MQVGCLTGAMKAAQAAAPMQMLLPPDRAISMLALTFK